MSEYRSAESELLRSLGREATSAELADKLGVSSSKIDEYERLKQQTVSINQKIGEDGDTEFGDFVPSEDNIDEISEVEFFWDDFKKALDSLPPTFNDKMKYVIMLRYGFYDGIPRTLEQTTEDLYKLGLTETKVTRERVRQIEEKALREMRLNGKIKQLGAYYGYYSGNSSSNDRSFNDSLVDKKSISNGTKKGREQIKSDSVVSALPSSNNQVSLPVKEEKEELTISLDAVVSNNPIFSKKDDIKKESIFELSSSGGMPSKMEKVKNSTQEVISSDKKAVDSRLQKAIKNVEGESKRNSGTNGDIRKARSEIRMAVKNVEDSKATELVTSSNNEEVKSDLSNLSNVTLTSGEKDDSISSDKCEKYGRIYDYFKRFSIDSVTDAINSLSSISINIAKKYNSGCDLSNDENEMMDKYIFQNLKSKLLDISSKNYRGISDETILDPNLMYYKDNTSDLNKVFNDLKSGNYDSARKSLENLSLTSDYNYFKYYGLLEKLENNFEEGIKYYGKGLRVTSEQPNSLIEVANLYIQTGNNYIGRKMLETLIDDKDYSFKAKINLIYLDILENKYEDAYKILQDISIQELDDNDLYLMDYIYKFLLYKLQNKICTQDNYPYVLSALLRKYNNMLLMKNIADSKRFLKYMDYREFVRDMTGKIQDLNGNHFALFDMYRLHLDSPIGYCGDVLTSDVCVSTVINTKEIVNIQPIILSEKYDLADNLHSQKLKLKRITLS